MKKWISGLIRRVIISAIREGEIKRFDATGLPGEEITDREMFQHYGFASSPQNSAEGILVGVGNVLYLIAEDDRRYRISLQQGEVSIYTDEGDKIHLKRGKEILIQSGGKVVVDAPEVDLGGDAGLKRVIHEAIVDLFNNHIHTWGIYNTSTPTAPITLDDVASAVTKTKQ